MKWRFPARRRCSSARLIVLLAITIGSPALAASPIDPDEGRPHVLWQDAERAAGRTAFVYGKIVSIGHARGIHFLNFDPQRRDVFKLVVFERNIERFSGSLEDLYLNKLVRVRGIVTRYAGVPQIELASPQQIQVLEALPSLEPAAARKRRPLGAELTIATFNVGNLFDDVDEPERPDEGTPAKPRDQLDALAATIRRLDADILALQEVENRDYLSRFVEVLLPDGGYEHIVHYEGNDQRGIDVCLLSRVPVGAVTSHRHLHFTDPQGRRRQFSRDLLRVPIEPEGGAVPLEIWLVHLKSNADGREQAEPIRLAEAHQVRKLLDQRLGESPGAALVVCGDFNDTPESASTQAIIGTGTHRLLSDWENVPPEHRITFNREPYRSMIDFLLWSPAMQARYVPKSYQVLDDEQVAAGSDHNPVVARFRWK